MAPKKDISKSKKSAKASSQKNKSSLYKNKSSVIKQEKKPLRKNQESSDEEEEEEASTIDLNKQNTEGMQNFTFEFSDVSSSHSNSLSTLFKPLVDNSTFGYELADAVCEQEEVGTVVNCEGDDDLFAMATALKISMVEKSQYFSHLAKVLKGLESHPSLSKTQSYKEISSLFFSSKSSSSLNSDNTAFFLYSRFLNFPLILSYELQRNIYEDIKWVKDVKNKEEIGEEIFNKFSKFENFLLVRPLDQSMNGLNNEEVFNSNNLLTHFFEDDVFLSHASHAIVTSSSSPLCGTQLLFMIIPYNKFEKILKDLKKLVE